MKKMSTSSFNLKGVEDFVARLALFSRYKDTFAPQTSSALLLVLIHRNQWVKDCLIIYKKKKIK